MNRHKYSISFHLYSGMPVPCEYSIKEREGKIKDASIVEKKKKNLEAISYELMGMCVEKGLTITEMLDIALMFPRMVKAEISKMEQKARFTVMSD